MKKIATLLLGLMFLFASCSNTKQNDNSAMTEKNKEVMKKVFEAFETGNTDSLAEFVSENTVDHTPDPMIKTTGLQAFKDMIAMNHTAYPDTKVTTISMIAEGDQVVAHYNFKGTNSGPYGTYPATNKPVDVNGVDIVRFENGKAVEHWGYYEENKMMTQLGVIPGMNTMGADSSKAKK